MKISLFLMVFIITTFLFSGSVSAIDYIIDNDLVYIDDNKVYLSARPHTITSSGYIYFNLTSKQYDGNIDVYWGFDTNTVKPAKIEYYNPYYINWTTNHQQSFYNVSNIKASNDDCNCGNEYNKYKRNITYQTTNLTYEAVTQTVCFDSYNIDGNNYTIYWHTKHSKLENWKDVSHNLKSINYNYDNKNKWWYINNFFVKTDKIYTVRIWLNMPISLKKTIGKYDFAIKRSSDTFQEAINNNRFYLLDPWWNSSWNYYKPITINHEYVNGTVINHTLLINITDTDLRDKAQADGDDIVFTNADNTIQLDHQIESTFNSTTGHLIAWIRIPSINNVSDTIINMYYNNSAATNTENPSDVWGINASGIWLMDEGTGTWANDSSSNTNNGSLTNMSDPPIATSGWDDSCKIDGGLQFDGVNDFVDAGSAVVLDDIDKGTWSAWIYPVGWGHDNRGMIMSKSKEEGLASQACFNFQLRNVVGAGEETLNFDIFYGTTICRARAVDNSINLNEWTHVRAAWNLTAKTADLYINGIEVSYSIHQTGVGTYNSNAAETQLIGATSYVNNGGNRWFYGSIDSAHIYNRIFATSKIATNYNNTNDPANFTTLGTEQSQIYIPSDPTNLQNTTGNFWINHTWEPGAGNITDSYNVSVNNVWHNETINTYWNITYDYGNNSWQNITIWAYNNSGTGNLSINSISQNTQLYFTNLPTNLQKTHDHIWVNWTWEESFIGTHIIDSYNVSINGTWYNSTTNQSYNHSGLDYELTSSIVVYGYNNTQGLSIYCISGNYTFQKENKMVDAIEQLVTPIQIIADKFFKIIPFIISIILFAGFGLAIMVMTSRLKKW